MCNWTRFLIRHIQPAKRTAAVGCDNRVMKLKRFYLFYFTKNFKNVKQKELNVVLRDDRFLNNAVTGIGFQESDHGTNRFHAEELVIREIVY